MTWGFFSVAHIISLFFALAMITAIYYLLRDRTEKVKTTVLGILSFAGICAIIFNLLNWGSPLEYLPLHLCSLNALALPIAVFTKNKVLNNLLLLWSVGALFALLVNTAVAETEIVSWTFVFYYFPHVLELGIPILMFLLKLTEKDLKCILSTVGITFSVYTLIHFINVSINSYAIRHSLLDSAGNPLRVNYMYSVYPENPLLDLFYKLIPLQYWYMYLSVVIVFLYLGLVYSKDILRFIKQKRNI